jgi:hypothetical protein
MRKLLISFKVSNLVNMLERSGRNMKSESTSLVLDPAPIYSFSLKSYIITVLQHFKPHNVCIITFHQTALGSSIY